MEETHEKVKSFIAILGLTSLIILASCQAKTATKKQTRTITDSMDHKVSVPTPQTCYWFISRRLSCFAGYQTSRAMVCQNGTSRQDYLAKHLKDVPTINYDLPFEVSPKLNQI